MSDSTRARKQAAATPSAPTPPSGSKPASGDSVPAKKSANTTASSSAAKQPAGTPASGNPVPARPNPDAAEEAAAEAERQARIKRKEAHWERNISQAGNDRTYPVVFDQSPPGVKEEVIRLLDGTEPRLSSMATSLSFAEKVKGIQDRGSVQVAILKAGDFNTICETFATQMITVNIPRSEGRTEKRTAFVPIPK